MIRELMKAAILAAGSLALSSCTPQPTVGAKKPAAPDYQAAVTPTPPPKNLKAICYSDADLATIRARMLHQELVVGTLQCQNPGGVRAFDTIYGSYLTKFKSDLATNARALAQLAGRKRLNVDVLVTEFSNRTAQQPPVDKEFCARSLRALEWSLDPKVTTLSQVPPPYDLGPDMNIHPCTEAAK
jgi:hypothetical protein